MLGRFDEAKKQFLAKNKEVEKWLRRCPEGEEAVDEQIWDEISAHENAQIIEHSKRLFSHLEPKTRAVVVLVKSGEFSIREAARVVGMENTKAWRVYKEFKC